MKGARKGSHQKKNWSTKENYTLHRDAGTMSSRSMRSREQFVRQRMPIYMSMEIMLPIITCATGGIGARVNAEAHAHIAANAKIGIQSSNCRRIGMCT